MHRFNRRSVGLPKIIAIAKAGIPMSLPIDLRSTSHCSIKEEQISDHFADLSWFFLLDMDGKGIRWRFSERIELRGKRDVRKRRGGDIA